MLMDNLVNVLLHRTNMVPNARKGKIIHFTVARSVVLWWVAAALSGMLELLVYAMRLSKAARRGRCPYPSLLWAANRIPKHRKTPCRVQVLPGHQVDARMPAVQTAAVVPLGRSVLRTR